VEPFVGSGAMLEKLLHVADCRSLWINDIDATIAAIWTSIRDHHDALITKLVRYSPSVDDFYSFRSSPHGDTVVDTAFRNIALHQMSYSGLGTMAGGPLGGRKQRSEYNVGCRWNSARLIAKIRWFHKRLRGATITSLDFADMLNGVESTAFVYCDPPYYVKGAALYEFPFSKEDHARLRTSVDRFDDWCVSYDDAPEIRALYAECAIHKLFKRDGSQVATPYTIFRGERPKNQEIVITPRQKGHCDG
jgi:DNA adenine methylase